MEQTPATAPYGLVMEGDKLTVASTRHPGLFDPRFLIAALLDHVARGDGEVCDEEATAMVQLVAEHFGLDAGQAETSLGHALNIYSRTMQLGQAGEILREVLGETERIDVMLMLLRVVAADGRQGADELEAVDEVAQALRLTAEERHLAFQRYFSEQEGQQHPPRRHIQQR